MASCTGNKMQRKRTASDVCGSYVFILTLLEVLGKTHMSVHDNNHAFIQANSNDVRFMGVHEGFQVFMHKEGASSNVRITKVHDELDSDDAFSTSTYLKFVPPRLDFKERHLGVPHLETVTLVNMDDNKTIHMSSVSGNTLHFHSSFFQDKTIPPKGNTTFAVVFLGRTEGLVSSSLYIHTSEGTFKYLVSGASICSPYRLRPLGGIRLPLNAAFQPLIHLHNPHHYPIQVVEVYSSGSDFHLELPGGEMEGPKAIWEVPPYTTKPVIRAKFQANIQSNHTAYIRLKLNNSEEVLVVPLEVEVTPQPGLYSQQHSIDFGIGGSLDEPKRVKLYLCSSLKKTLWIQNVSAVPETLALKINFEAAKIPPGTSPVEVAELEFDWKLAFETKQTSGKIVIRSKHNQYRVVIPFTSTVLEGRLKVNEHAMRFLTDSKLFPRHLTVENQFKVPVAVNNVSLPLEASLYFQIKNFKSLVIPPKKLVTLLTLLPNDNYSKDFKLESGLVLSTNVSDVIAPLLVYNGKLTKIFPRGFEDLELLDVGLVGSGSVKTLRIGLENNNPVEIEINSVKSNSQFFSPQILGIFSKNSSEFLSQYKFANLLNSTKLNPNDIMVMEIVIRAPANEGIVLAQVTITSQYENLIIPMRVSVAHGRLEVVPRQIVLDDCFPGKFCVQPVKVLSTFNRPMSVTSISSIPPDARLSFVGAPGGSEILPGSSSCIGDLKWDAGKNCGTNCYLGVPLNSSANGLHWMQSDHLAPYVSDTDVSLLLDRYHRLLNITKGFGSGYWQEIILRLDTNEVREEIFKAKVKLIWPRISETNKFVFPLTQVSNTTVQRLKLSNYASHTVVVQLVAEWAYPQAKRLIESFPPSVRSNMGRNCFNSAPKEFYIAQSFSSDSDPVGKLSTTLAPGEIYEVSIGYSPKSAQKSCSYLFVRNNLTVVEIVELHGQSSYAQLKFGNRKPGSENPLMFEIAEKHLKDCQRDKNKKLSNPNLTVKRSFTVRNVGDLTVFVHRFYINGLECEGYGFSVLNCEPFELPINGTKKIDVAFTPDFTLTKIQRTLSIDTSLGIDVNYTLVTTLPPFFLSACASALSRPTWEPLLYYSAVSFMVFLLFCVLAAAFFESDRILKCALMTLTRERTTVQLDLRQIGTHAQKEFNPYPTRKVDSNSEHIERAKHKDGICNTSGWPQGSSSEEKGNKDEKLDCRSKGEDPTVFSRDKDNTSASISGMVQLNNLTRNKKKISKRNSTSSDVNVEQCHDPNVSHKKKEKSLETTGWCGVFSKGNTEKSKSKGNVCSEVETLKQIRNDTDGKREEKRTNKNKKIGNREPNKEEEETSSTMTDSSNDAEKENSESSTRMKNEKPKKTTRSKERKSGCVLDCKDNNYETCEPEDEELDKEKRINRNSPTSKVNVKSGKMGSGSAEANTSLWKSTVAEVVKTNDFQKQKMNKNFLTRDKKEKTVNKRKFSDKIANPKMPDSSTFHRSSPCWEHRSFSEVVARNDSPLLYSNIVSARSPQQKQQIPSESIFSESPKVSDASPSILGPIGSKKPLSHWSPLPCEGTSARNQSNIFPSYFPEALSGFLKQPNLTGGDFLGGSSNILENSLPIDPENLWEDQHAAMQLMHEQDPSYQLTWKENWLDYLWSSNRNVQQGGASTHNNYDDQSWGSTLRPHLDWGSPTLWSPSTSQSNRTSDDSTTIASHFSGYSSLPENEGLVNSDSQGTNMSVSGPMAHGPPSLNHVLFSQCHTSPSEPQSKGRTVEGNVAHGGFQFDSYHSLSSIWSPKSQNSWNSPGNQ
ncbi:hypothetical protein RUM44_007562 [Polyplax serrata]|uniref:Transmembrane protein 131 n=1 Tax=Polyplax serrata TaxID=468196 RepID=A0ABR1B6W1_POLSC